MLELDLTKEEIENLNRKLAVKLNKFFEPYEMKLLEEFVDTLMDISKEGDISILYYTVSTEANNDKDDFRYATCEFATDGKNIFKIDYPEIPENINKRTNLEEIENTL